MSNRRRTPRPSSRRPSRRPSRELGRAGQPLPVTTIKNPGDVVTIVPYLLGFDPSESLVVVALEGPRRRFGPCARLDLVDDPGGPRHQVDYVSALVRHHGFSPVIVVAYSERAVLADTVVRAVLERLAAEDVEVFEAVRADGQRWWSYLCDDPVCCPASGTAYDPGSSRMAAEAVAAGLSRAPSRDALREWFEPHPERRRALAAVLDGMDGAPSLTPEETALAVLEALHEPGDLSPAAQAQLVRAVQDVQARDAAWALMQREDAREHFLLWVSLLRAAPDALMAPVGGLAAFAAWLTGRGVLASHGAERVLAVHPDYSMARLLLELCDASVDPAVWPRMSERFEPDSA